jgi:cytochrome d ubiquinol oxidase subunit II
VPAVLGIAALGLAVVLDRRRPGLAFAATALATVLLVVTLFTGLYPRVMVSDPSFGNSLTVENASSQHYTLAVMTVVAVLVTPVVLLYQAWTYRVFRHRLELPEA